MFVNGSISSKSCIVREVLGLPLSLFINMQTADIQVGLCIMDRPRMDSFCIPVIQYSCADTRK